MSRWTIVPISPTKNSFPQWLGTSNVFYFLLKTQTRVNTWQYHSYTYGLYGNPLPPAAFPFFFCSLSSWKLFSNSFADCDPATLFRIPETPFVPCSSHAHPSWMRTKRTLRLAALGIWTSQLSRCTTVVQVARGIQSGSSCITDHTLLCPSHSHMPDASFCYVEGSWLPQVEKDFFCGLGKSDCQLRGARVGGLMEPPKTAGGASFDGSFDRDQ